MNDEDISESKLIGNTPPDNGPKGPPPYWGSMMQYQSYASSNPLLAHSLYLSQLSSMGYPPPSFPMNRYSLPVAAPGHFHMGQADVMLSENSGASAVTAGDQATAERLSSIERRK
jgi:hypothetical protein